MNKLCFVRCHGRLNWGIKIDYLVFVISSVVVVQPILSRTSLFDNSMPIPTVEDVIGLKPAQFWLNVEMDMFYNTHKLSPAAYVEETLKFISYISSPEINFLKAMSGKVGKKGPKLILRFKGADAIEPTTKKPYSSLLKDLASIKSYASGILVPKEYIWPVTKGMYLEDATTLVTDAHKAGLEVHAYGFANDQPASYNYSYDPTAEYLQFIDNSKFSVDGVLTDFPPTASAAVGCLAHSKNNSKAGKKDLLVISSNGASGVYAASTDLAYQQAVADGADIIDCSVQMSKDGIPFCLSSADLMEDTTAITTFMARSTMIPEIKDKKGIFSFDLTWSEIQTVKPQLTSSIPNAQALPRNPANKNKGKFMTLQEFLDFAKTKPISGILINIENAAYLASNKGLSITDAVASALSNATLDKQSTQQVLIRSDDSSVLSKFKDVPTYKRVLNIEKVVGDAPQKPVEEIKKFADAVTITRASVIKTTSDAFTSGNTTVVKELHAANISVYVGILRNEFTTIAFDLFSDPMVEIATYRVGFQVDGIITEYPGTAAAYLRSPCSDMNDDNGYKILPAETGALLPIAAQESRAPAEAPASPLDVADVVDPPLPPVKNASTSPPAPVPEAPHSSSGSLNVINMVLSFAAISVLCILSLGITH